MFYIVFFTLVILFIVTFICFYNHKSFEDEPGGLALVTIVAAVVYTGIGMITIHNVDLDDRRMEHERLMTALEIIRNEPCKIVEIDWGKL